jgi:COP9 signalosome complex subunit 1
VAATDHSFEARRAAVDKELSVARENLVKESTRQGHTALGDLLYGRGEVAEAQRQYMRTRDYCAAPAHVVGMCLR